MVKMFSLCFTLGLLFAPLGAADDFGWRPDKAKGVITLQAGGTAFTIKPDRDHCIRAEGSGVDIWMNGRRDRDETFFLHRLKSVTAVIDEAHHKVLNAVYSVADEEGNICEGTEVELHPEISRDRAELRLRSVLRNISEKAVWPKAILIWHFSSDSPTYFTPGPTEWTYEGAWHRALGRPPWLYLPHSAGGVAIFSKAPLSETGGGPGRTSLYAHNGYVPVPPGVSIEHDFSIMPSPGTEETAAAYVRRLFPSSGIAEALASLESHPFEPKPMTDVIVSKPARHGFGFEIDKEKSLITLSTDGTTYSVKPSGMRLISVSDSGVGVGMNCRMRRDEVLYPRTLRDVRVEADAPGRKRLTALYVLANRQGDERDECELEIVMEISDASDGLLLDATFSNRSTEEWPESNMIWCFTSDAQNYFTRGPRMWRFGGTWEMRAGEQGWLYVPQQDGGLGVLPSVPVGEGGGHKGERILTWLGYGPTPAGGKIEHHYLIFPANSVEDVMAGCLQQVACMTLGRRAYLSGEQVRVARLRIANDRLASAKSARGVLATSEGRVISTWSCAVDEIAEQGFPTDTLADGEYTVTLDLLDKNDECAAAAIERLRVANGDNEQTEREIVRAAERVIALRDSDLSTQSSLKNIAAILAEARVCHGEREFASAQKHLDRLSAKMADIESGREKYFSDVALRLKEVEGAKAPLITISWRPDTTRTTEGIEWAKKLGATELCYTGQPSAEELRRVRSAGLRTAAIFNGLCRDDEWAKEHPEHRQIAYYVTGDTRAESKELATPVPLGDVGWGGLIKAQDAKGLWRVEDANTGALVSVDEWELDTDAKEVRIKDATPGHSYRVYYVVPHSSFCDPVYPEFRAHAIKKLQEYLKTVEGCLQTFFTDDTAYAWLGHMPGGAYEWDSYHFCSSPGMQRGFEKATGIKFNPAMLVGKDIPQAPALPPELDSADNRPPSDQYLALRAFAQGVTNEWAKQATDMCRRHGVSVWHYWGDAHVGVEPYLGGLEAGGIADIDKPCWGSPFCATIMRTLTDFPGPAKRRTRLRWVTHALKQADPAAGFMSVWVKAKRALLFRMIDGLYWMPFDAVLMLSNSAKRDDLLEAIKKINNDFAFMHAKLIGREVFTHDLTLYVVNAWGKVYSWHPWPNRKGLPVFLDNLTDLPIQVRFVSLRELAKGVPDDADILLNYGTPGSSWNGGYLWTLPGVVENVREFVAQGGALIGVGAPSHFEKDKVVWQLRELLGVECGGQERPAIEAELTDVGRKHWITQTMPDQFNLDNGWNAKPIAADLQTLFAVDGDQADVPAVAARSSGKGRVCYINGYGTSSDYYQLVRRAIFWCGRREDDLARLCSTTPGVFTYLYPGIKTLVIYNATSDRTKANVTFDVSLLQLDPGARFELRDMVSGETICSASGAELRRGFTAAIAPGGARFIEFARRM